MQGCDHQLYVISINSKLYVLKCPNKNAALSLLNQLKRLKQKIPLFLLFCLFLLIDF